jgi:hypothetical protein
LKLSSEEWRKAVDKETFKELCERLHITQGRVRVVTAPFGLVWRVIAALYWISDESQFESWVYRMFICVAVTVFYLFIVEWTLLKSAFSDALVRSLICLLILITASRFLVQLFWHWLPKGWQGLHQIVTEYYAVIPEKRRKRKSKNDEEDEVDNSAGKLPLDLRPSDQFSEVHSNRGVYAKNRQS